MEREEGVAIPELLVGALAFYRAPQRLAQLRDPRQPLPPGVSELLAAGAQALAPEHEADTAARLGSSPKELHDAQLFFIRQALLEAGGDHYRTLGVARDADTAQIRQHYHYLIRLFHPDRDLDNEGWDTLYAPAINEAWNVLRHPDKRAAYDAGLAARRSAAEAIWQAPPAAAPARAAGARSAARTSGAQRVPRTGWLGPATLLVVVLATLALLALTMWRERNQPVLRVALAPVEGRPGPARERVAIASGAHADSGRAEAAPAAREAAPRPARQTAASRPSVEERVSAHVQQATLAVLGPERAQDTRPGAASPDTAVASTASPDIAAVVASGPGATLTADPPLVAAAQPVLLSMAEAVPPAAPSQEPLPALERAELDALMKELAASYEAGDAERFAALFSEQAITTDARGRDAIRALYEDFFARPESRRMRLQRLRWQDYGPYRSGGTARAELITTPFDGGASARGVLKLSIVVEQSPQGPWITGLQYQ